MCISVVYMECNLYSHNIFVPIAMKQHEMKLLYKYKMTAKSIHVLFTLPSNTNCESLKVQCYVYTS